MNRVLGYRKMAKLTQCQMGELLGISEVTYRKKEKGISDFTQTEMKKFLEAVRIYDKEVTIEDIFFNQ